MRSIIFAIFVILTTNCLYGCNDTRDEVEGENHSSKQTIFTTKDSIVQFLNSPQAIIPEEDIFDTIDNIKLAHGDEIIFKNMSRNAIIEVAKSELIWGSRGFLDFPKIVGYNLWMLRDDEKVIRFLSDANVMSHQDKEYISVDTNQANEFTQSEAVIEFRKRRLEIVEKYKNRYINDQIFEPFHVIVLNAMRNFVADSNTLKQGLNHVWYGWGNSLGKYKPLDSNNGYFPILHQSPYEQNYVFAIGNEAFSIYRSDFLFYQTTCNMCVGMYIPIVARNPARDTDFFCTVSTFNTNERFARKIADCYSRSKFYDNRQLLTVYKVRLLPFRDFENFCGGSKDKPLAVMKIDYYSYNGSSFDKLKRIHINPLGGENCQQ